MILWPKKLVALFRFLFIYFIIIAFLHLVYKPGDMLFDERQLSACLSATQLRSYTVKYIINLLYVSYKYQYNLKK